MFARNFVAASALLSVAAAVPMQGHMHHQHPHAKRDIVWVTNTEVEVVTVPVTYTVWVDPDQTAPSSSAAYIAPDASVAAASAPTSSPPEAAPSPDSAPAYSAPSTTSSTSEYVPPSYAYVAPSSSSVAPTPSGYEAPADSSTEAASTSSAAAAADSSGSSSSSSGGSGLSYGMAKAGTSYTGDITYYTPGLGSCGMTSTDNDPIVAIAESMFDSYSAEAGGNPNNNPVCNKKISITGTDGSAYSATVVDRCAGCAEGSIDLSPTLFKTVAPDGDGRVHDIKWTWD